MWSDDGFVVRYPDGERPPDTSLLIPDPDEVERLVVRQLGSTAMFAARFREAAGRALLLPRRRPGARAPLWQLRKRASDLLAVAARYGSFPIILETYRECLRDIFDLPALTDILTRIRSRTIRVVDGRIADAVAVLVVAAVRLRRELPLRRRCAARRTARAGALGRSIAAARSDRRHRAARSARRSGARHGRERAAASAAAVPCALDGRDSRSVAAARRSVARGDRGAQRERRRRSRRSTSWSRRGGR